MGERQERHAEHPQERAERGDLRPRRHECRHAGGRPLVGVRRPHVERYGRDLEAEADGQEPDRDQRERIAVHATGECRRNAGKVRGARRAVGEGDAIEEERRGERAQEEVLHRRLGRRQATEREPREQVEREGEDLEREEDQDEVARGGDERHPRGREQQQRVVLAAGLARPVQVVRRQQDPERRRGQDDQAEVHREAIGGDHPAEHDAGPLPGPERERRRRGAGHPGQTQQHERTLVGRRPERVEQHERERRPDEDQLRQERPQDDRHVGRGDGLREGSHLRVSPGYTRTA